ncbi:MAG: glycosyltransferase, partial [Bacteroidota bacterium]
MFIIASIFTACMLFYGGFVFWSGWWFERIRVNETLPAPLLPSITILIPARNEADHLSHTLHSVFGQEYPQEKLEILLINDHSQDGTLAIAQLLQTRYPHFKIIDLTEGTEGKKAAIASGVAVARGEIILQLDADCYVSADWAAAMASHFVGNTAMVAGPVELAYSHDRLERLQAIETMGLVALAGGAIGAGRPNMVNGANLAYTKAVFEEVNGFEGVDHVASGDDELLMQKIHRLKKYQIRFAKNRHAVVRTHALPDWASLRAQRLRWVSKA